MVSTRSGAACRVTWLRLAAVEQWCGLRLVGVIPGAVLDMGRLEISVPFVAEYVFILINKTPKDVNRHFLVFLRFHRIHRTRAMYNLCPLWRLCYKSLIAGCQEKINPKSQQYRIWILNPEVATKYAWFYMGFFTFLRKKLCICSLNHHLDVMFCDQIWRARSFKNFICLLFPLTTTFILTTFTKLRYTFTGQLERLCRIK